MPTEVKISELPDVTTPSTTMQFEVNDSGTSKKVTGTQVVTLVQNNIQVSDTNLADIIDLGTIV
jgi:hypothetical protein